MQFFNMLLVLVKSCVICGAVSSLKHHKEVCVVDGVGVSNNDNLHVQLEVAVTLIPFELHPLFTGAYCATCHMRPSGDLHVTMRGEGKSNKSTTSYSRLQLWR